MRQIFTSWWDAGQEGGDPPPSRNRGARPSPSLLIEVVRGGEEGIQVLLNSED